ncbi:SWIM zinc finger family protein [Natrinema halophilum]|uniref:SWIM zinc finger family protein n=1 Tax=Natrinema halophilum TaxID=1699371 RepID=UPI001F3555CA|nr:SWIM zinc finger family protein [Natrinema halophilum]UHQ96441.1 SWIM zinc finger domain-containing protein [Natrinema halophilum]
MAAAEPTHDPTAGIDEATLTRDRRGAEQSMGIWPIADDLWGVGTGSGEEYSEYLVDLRRGRCTCDDWQYRGEPGSGQITRCKHAARILQALGRTEPPADADPSPELAAQRTRWSR